MSLHGKNFIGSEVSAAGSKQLFGFDPRRGERIPQPFWQATPDEIHRAATCAAQSFPDLRRASSELVASLLQEIAQEIDLLGEALISHAIAESGLPEARLTGERARTTGQLRLFAELVKEGSFVDARIDVALPDRKPLPRPDLRRMLIPLGPVAVFGASNFPLAFSVAGGDTAAALAAKCPVIVKAHPAHPATSELVAGAIARAIQRVGLPPGIFSLLHGADPEVSLHLVREPAVKAVAFTGSERAGRALFNAASQRPEPIPAYVEMGSNNPVFLLPGALAASADQIAQSLFGSINLGVGQFCTSPGVIIGTKSGGHSEFASKLKSLFEQGAPGTMLTAGILQAYQVNVDGRSKEAGVESVRSSQSANAQKTEALPVLFETDSQTWLSNEKLGTELFGPSAVLVTAQSSAELVSIAEKWTGTLTASIFGTAEDLHAHQELIDVLSQKAGRLLFNGLPTGVEVSPAMHHGGPYPATADAKFTSVGTASIFRFLRPICYQNFAVDTLPVELGNENSRGIWRMINGQLTKEAL